MNRKKQMTPEMAYVRLTALCARTECCKSDVRKKLAAWCIEAEDAEKIVAKLAEEKYIDEARYAVAFANEKIKFARWGTSKVSFNLRQKGLSADLIENALSQILPDDYGKMMEQTLRAKFRTLNYKDRNDARAKLLRFGAGRGFEFAKMKNIIYGITEDIDQNDDEVEFY